MTRSWMLLLVGGTLAVRGAAQVSEAEIRTAATKSVALLQKAGDMWLAKQSCVSCHQQSLPLMTIGVARRKGIAVDQPALEKQFTKAFAYESDLDKAVQGSHIFDPVMMEGYALVATAPL